MYCEKKIEKEQEICKDVKIPGFIGTSKKAFCCLEHTENYEKEVNSMRKKKCCCR